MAGGLQMRLSGCSMLLSLALVAVCMGPLAAAQGSPGCPTGQVWDDAKGRCAVCPVGTVKWPDVDGAQDAQCVSPHLACGTAEVAKFGSCFRCPPSQVALDATRCANCPLGTTKEPSQDVRDATCKPICVPSPEVCNGKDDDCDGLVDEELGTVSCGTGVCARTIPACVAGKLQVCKPGTPKRETCNGLDDDCDGLVDENLGTITCGKGACASTVDACVAGKAPKCKPKAPSAEVCDGIDNNCDGQVDEGIADLFCTPCNKKVPGCAAGKLTTCAGVCPKPCCEDCANFLQPMDSAKCFAACQNCKDERKCLEWSDSIADKVAEAVCEETLSACGIIQFNGGDNNDGRQVTQLQCYYAAYDQCSSRGSAFVKQSTEGACSYYATGGGTCTAAEFQAKVDSRLDQLCQDVSTGIATALP